MYEFRIKFRELTFCHEEIGVIISGLLQLFISPSLLQSIKCVHHNLIHSFPPCICRKI